MPLLIFPHSQSDIQLHQADFSLWRSNRRWFKTQQGGEKLHRDDQWQCQNNYHPQTWFYFDITWLFQRFSNGTIKIWNVPVPSRTLAKALPLSRPPSSIALCSSSDGHLLIEQHSHPDWWTASCTKTFYIRTRIKFFSCLLARSTQASLCSSRASVNCVPPLTLSLVIFRISWC